MARKFLNDKKGLGIVHFLGVHTHSTRHKKLSESQVVLNLLIVNTMLHALRNKTIPD